jgi:2-C-methyl-D-erythritol 4-phosphate cytidylyltransferase
VAHTINTFSEALPGAEIVVVLPEEHIPLWRNLAARFDVAVHRCIAGGKERFHSVKNGLDALSSEVEFVAVHDGVRALATKKMILRVQLAAEEMGAAIPVTEVVDSYRRVEGENSYIVPRADLRIVQTPQIFNAQLLRDAYNVEFNAAFTDDASVVEARGGHITLVDGERTNIKITTPEDIALAECFLNLM